MSPWSRNLALFLCTALIGCGGASYSGSNGGSGNTMVPPGTLGVVQVAKQDCESVLCATAPPLVFSNPVTPGDSIAVVFWFNHANGATANSTSDNNHDTYTNVLAVQQSQNNTAVVYLAKNIYGGSTQVSIVGPPPNSSFSAVALELSGVYGDVDGTQSQSVFPFSGGLCSSGTINTTHSDVILGFTLNNFTLHNPITYGAGFTGQFQTSYFAVETQVVNTTGSIAATFTTGPTPDQQAIYVATSGVVGIY